MNQAEFVDEPPIRRLLGALPGPIRRAVTWLLKPAAKWIRIPAGILLMVGGLLGFLPLLGFWMIPLGALLLAEDIPPLRRPTLRGLAAIQSWWDRRRARRH